MIGDLDRATIAFGDRGYRYVHFEAGAIGHRMYLAAEALGLRATGIGAFYDEEVHSYLELTPSRDKSCTTSQLAIRSPIHASRHQRIHSKSQKPHPARSQRSCRRN